MRSEYDNKKAKNQNTKIRMLNTTENKKQKKQKVDPQFLFRKTDNPVLFSPICIHNAYRYTVGISNAIYGYSNGMLVSHSPRQELCRYAKHGYTRQGRECHYYL